MGGADPALREDDGGDRLGHERREALRERDFVLPFHRGLRSGVQAEKLEAEDMAAVLGLHADDGDEEAVLATPDRLVAERQLPVREEREEDLRVYFKTEPHAVGGGPEDVPAGQPAPNNPSVNTGLGPYPLDYSSLFVVFPYHSLLVLHAKHVDVPDEVALSSVL